MPKNKQPFDYRQAAGIFIGHGAVASGRLDVSDDVIIDGNFTGNITTSGVCEVSENGQVEAELFVHSFTVFGRYKGHCKAEESIVVKNTADVEGFLVSSSINIQPGATVKARLKPNEGHA